MMPQDLCLHNWQMLRLLRNAKHHSWQATRVSLMDLYISVHSKKRFFGRGRPRFSRSVFPSYSRRNSSRRCSSGTTRSTKSSSPPGRYGNIILKPSQPGEGQSSKSASCGHPRGSPYPFANPKRLAMLLRWIAEEPPIIGKSSTSRT